MSLENFCAESLSEIFLDSSRISQILSTFSSILWRTSRPFLTREDFEVNHQYCQDDYGGSPEYPKVRIPEEAQVR